jgi:hypothetical protein
MMNKVIVKAYILLLVVGLIVGMTSTVAAQVQPTTFGMHMQRAILSQQPYPSVSFGSQRLWNSATGWAQINTSPGIYKWGVLDQWMELAATHNVKLLYTFGHTPKWASSAPNNTNCSNEAGSCAPPEDLNRDGTGTNQHWKDFVSAIANHAAGRIKHWEIWNEPSNAWEWTGTQAQMVRMAKDARQIILSIDPAAQIVSPSIGISTTMYQSWMEAFLNAGGGQYVDIIAFHGYIHHPPNEPVAEDFIPKFNQFKTMVANHGQSGKPLWDTEGSWGKTAKTGFTNPDKQAGFTARFSLLNVSSGVSRFFWYEWNNQESGTLWKPDPNNPSAPGTLLKPGIAYRTVRSWIVNNKLTSKCAAGSDSIWRCEFTRPNATQIMPVWYPGGSKTFIAAAKFRKYQDVYGNIYSIPSNGSVTAGYKPILLMP